MTDYDMIEFDDGTVLTVDQDGVVIDSADINDRTAFVARQRHLAREQAKEWERRYQVLDRILLRDQKEKKVAYGDTVVSVGGGAYYSFDADAFADDICVIPLELEHLWEIIAAAKDYTKDKLPKMVRAAYEKNRERHEKRPWIETSIARKVAQRVTKAEPDLLPDLEASLDAERAKRGVTA